MLAACLVLWSAAALVRGFDRLLIPAAVVVTVWAMLHSRMLSMLRSAVLGHDAGWASGYASGLREGLGLRSRLAGMTGRRLPRHPASGRDRRSP